MSGEFESGVCYPGSQQISVFIRRTWTAHLEVKEDGGRQVARGGDTVKVIGGLDNKLGSWRPGQTGVD